MHSPIRGYKQQRNVSLRLIIKNIKREREGLTSSDIGILRMIKLFAWESHILENVEKCRDEELKELKKTRLLEAVLSLSNTIIPIISKVVVITIYVSLLRLLILVRLV